MAGYVRFALGEGVSSARYAYVDGSGTRYPSSGYSSTTTGTALSNVDHLFIYDIVLESGYSGWNAVYGRSNLYDSKSALPTSGSTTQTNINIYPSSSTTSSNRATVTITSTAASSTYTLQYRSNDGSSILYTDTGTSYSGSYTFTVRSSATPPAYHYFSGWATSRGSSTVTYTGGERLTVYGTQSLYAVFTRYTPTIYKQVYYRESASGSYSYQNTYTETVGAGYSYTPSASTHVPTHDSNYELTQIVDSNGTDYTTGSFIVPSGGATLLYRFTKKQLTSYLYYNANGGSGGPSTQSGIIESGSGSYSFKIPDTEPTRSSYVFQGWAESSTASSASYHAGDRYSVVAGGSATLWAVWKQLNTFTLTYNANGGSGAPGDQTATSTDTSYTFTVRSGTPTKSGYIFMGWANSSSATSAEYHAGSRITVSGTHTLWAVWATAHTHTLVYNANGGSGAPSSESVTDANTTYTFTVSRTVPVRDGYDFLGWANSDSATKAEYSGGDTISVAGLHTLYAVWEEQVKALVPEATFTVTSRTDTTMTIKVTQTNLEAGIWSFQISRDQSFGTVINASSSVSYTSESLSSAFSGLTPNAYYYVRVWNTYNGVTLYAVLNGGGRTGITTFAWTSNDSVYVVSGAVLRTAITAAKWNALGAKIDEVSRRQGAGGVSYSTVSPAQRITAALFNAARNTIAALSGASGAPSAQSKGDGMKASLFVALKDAINSAINYTNNHF